MTAIVAKIALAQLPGYHFEWNPKDHGLYLVTHGVTNVGRPLMKDVPNEHAAKIAAVAFLAGYHERSRVLGQPVPEKPTKLIVN